MEENNVKSSGSIRWKHVNSSGTGAGSSVALLKEHSVLVYKNRRTAGRREVARKLTDLTDLKLGIQNFIEWGF